MTRGADLENRDAQWRYLAWASGAAVAVIVLLAISVMAIWTLARAPASAPPFTAQDTATPTPRALSFRRDQPTGAGPLPTPLPAATSDNSAPVQGEIPATTRPELLNQSGAVAESPIALGAELEAPKSIAFSALASGSWSATDDLLSSDGAGGIAEPWLPLAAVPSPAFAVEADVRLGGLIDNVCGQSFGLTAGSPSANQWYGGGVHFPCENAPREARLTDVSVWQDGYNGDPAFAQALYDPGDDWHTYRFELRGDHVRLIVDGIGIADGMLAAPIDPATTDGQAGIWTQGAAIEIRRIAVYTLPAR